MRRVSIPVMGSCATRRAPPRDARVPIASAFCITLSAEVGCPSRAVTQHTLVPVGIPNSIHYPSALFDIQAL